MSKLINSQKTREGCTEETWLSTDGEEFTITRSSGNVFRDLVLPNPNRLLKQADLLFEIQELAKLKKVKSKKLANLTGIKLELAEQLLKGDFPNIKLPQLRKIINALKDIQKYTDNEYLEAELYQDRDLEIRCLTRKIVRVRKAQRCAFADVLQKPHDIEKGTRAIRESAIVENQWGSNYSCLKCVDIWLDELNEL